MIEMIMNRVYQDLHGLRSTEAGAGTAAKQPIHFYAIGKPNAVLVIAPPAEMPGVMKLAAQLDRPVVADTEFQVFPIRHGYAAQIAKSVSDFYKGRTGLGTVVMAVPDSAVPGGIGYAAESGLPYIEGLIKNRYIGRTFISPDQAMRSRGVHLKFNPVVENLTGQRVVVVDDSIVRGTTTPRIVTLLREAGATEVHLRITSPPIKHPCYLGVDMATYDELIAANYTVDEIRQRTGADSLGYLSLDGLIAAVGRKREEMCLGCFVGDYPNLPAAHEVRAGAPRLRALR